MDNEYQTTRIWKQTLRTLKHIAASTDSSIVETMDRLASQEWERVQRTEEIIVEKATATLAEAVQAKSEGKVVLADWTGRRVTINRIVQNASTGEWSAEWSHPDYIHSRWDTISEDQQFIIRGKYGSHR